MSNRDPDVARLEEAVQSLSEHFDSVHIFATRHETGEDNGTISCNRGCGNWFARNGQIREWVLKAEERSKAEVRKEEG